jgi:hypothetical protein
LTVSKPRIVTYGSAPPEYFAVIGRIVIESALLESLAHNLLRRLLGLDNDHDLYNAIRPRTAKSLFEAIGKTAKQKLTNEEFGSLKTTLKEIERAETGVLARRNRVNHSVWSTTSDTDGIPTIKRSTDIFVEAVEAHTTFPLDELTDLADEIEQRSNEILFLRSFAEWNSERRASRDK